MASRGSDSDTSESDISSSPGSVAGPSEGRKRSQKPETHKRAVAKIKRNKGEAYTSPSSGRAVPKCVIGAPCCDKCFEKVTRGGVESIFKAFWEIGDYNLQNAYIQKLVETIPIARKRTTAEKSRRSVTKVYTVSYNNQRVKVCLSGFLAMHGIGQKRVNTAVSP